MTFSMTPAEINLFRSLKKSAIVLLLMFRLDKPIGATEISDILEIDIRTSRRYLRSLSRLGYVARIHFHDGYILTNGGRQLILPAAVHELEPGKMSQVGLTTTTINLTSLIDSVVVEESKPGKISQVDEEPLDPEILEAFDEVGIGLNKRSEALARQEHVTPEYIRAHAAALRKRKQRGYHIGLLITIMESGQPPPEPDGQPAMNKSCPGCGGPWLGDDFHHNRNCPELEES